jgi:hypothetical protein
MILSSAEDSCSTSSPSEQKSSFYAWVAFVFVVGLQFLDHGPAKDKLLEDLDELFSNFGEELVAGEIPSLQELNDIEDIMSEAGLYAAVPELRFIEERVQQSNNLMERYGLQRQLFRAKRGMLGSGSNLARPGDQVWLLQRMNTPVLLRPTETPDQFKIVGECYLHGCTNGELFSHGYLDRNSAKPIVIV